MQHTHTPKTSTPHLITTNTQKYLMDGLDMEFQSTWRITGRSACLKFSNLKRKTMKHTNMTAIGLGQQTTQAWPQTYFTMNFPFEVNSVGMSSNSWGSGEVSATLFRNKIIRNWNYAKRTLCSVITSFQKGCQHLPIYKGISCRDDRYPHVASWFAGLWKIYCTPYNDKSFPAWIRSSKSPRSGPIPDGASWCELSSCPP